MDVLKNAVGATVAVAAILPPNSVNEVLDIPLALLLAGCAGAMFGLAYTPPEKWGKLLAVPKGPTWRRACVMILRAAALLFTLAGIVFVMGWFTVAAPHIPGLGWSKPIPPAAVCGILSFAGQFWLPRIIAAGNRWIDGRGKVP